MLWSDKLLQEYIDDVKTIQSESKEEWQIGAFHGLKSHDR